MVRHGRRLVALAGALVLFGAACDGGGGGGGSVAEFCGLEDEFSDVEIPTREQVNQGIDAAPSEIKDDVRRVFNAVLEAGDDEEALTALGQDEELIESSQRINTFIEEKCNGDGGGNGDGDGDGGTEETTG